MRKNCLSSKDRKVKVHKLSDENKGVDNSSDVQSSRDLTEKVKRGTHKKCESHWRDSS